MKSTTDRNWNSQRHGVDFENIVKMTTMFQGACNMARSGVAVFDIEGACDPVFHLATSVKTTGDGWIGLADAPRLYEINLPFRYVIGDWRQVEDVKLFDVVHELIIPLRIMSRIRGDLTHDEVLAFHTEITSFAPGPAGAQLARARYRQIKKEVAGRHGILRLDFKVDDGGQRRLQMSVRLRDLVAIVQGEAPYATGPASQPLHVEHRGRFCQHVLPIQLVSPQRRTDRLPDDGETVEPQAEMFGAAETCPPPIDDPMPITTRPPRGRRDDRRRPTGDAAAIAQPRMFGA